jgi:nicotinamidase-related amidase
MRKTVLTLAILVFFAIASVSLTDRTNAAEPLWKIGRDRTALLVIDMQNDFIKPGACLEVPEARNQIPEIKKLIEAARRFGVPVVYTAHIHRSDGTDMGLMKYWPMINNRTCLVEGSEGAQVYPEIAPKGNERTVLKNRYSAFYNTNLETILRSLRGAGVVDTLIISGTVTNICVESTTRDAFFRDFKIVFAKNACSALPENVNPGAQKATEDIVRIAFFGRVMSVDEIISILEKGE